MPVGSLRAAIHDMVIIMMALLDRAARGPVAGDQQMTVARARLTGQSRVLFAAVEGRAAFDKGDVFDTIATVIRGAPEPFVRAGPLRRIIAGLLFADPERQLTTEQARNALLKIERRTVGQEGTE